MKISEAMKHQHQWLLVHEGDLGDFIDLDPDFKKLPIATRDLLRAHRAALQTCNMTARALLCTATENCGDNSNAGVTDGKDHE